MTDNNHPITPPLELTQKWVDDAIGPDYEQRIAIQAARWGADQELEACCEWLNDNFDHCNSIDRSDWLRAARRPKPPSLKEQALEALDSLCVNDTHENIIRRALESLPN